MAQRLQHLVPDAKRPFKLYHAQKKKFFKWRWYSRKYVAMRNAYWIAKWIGIGETVEVIDVRTGKVHGIYTHHVTKGEHHVHISGETLKKSQDRISLPGEDDAN